LTPYFFCISFFEKTRKQNKAKKQRVN